MAFVSYHINKIVEIETFNIKYNVKFVGEHMSSECVGELSCR